MAAALAGLFFYSSCSPTEKAETKDYTRYVNTFIGAADNGHTFPGACYPFGMIQSSPVTGAVGWRYCSEYTYQDSLIWGFTQTHLNGTGCMDLGDILVMPVTGTRTRAWDAYRSHFPKDKEAAAPGYCGTFRSAGESGTDGFYPCCPASIYLQQSRLRFSADRSSAWSCLEGRTISFTREEL